MECRDEFGHIVINILLKANRFTSTIKDNYGQLPLYLACINHILLNRNPVECSTSYL